MKQEFLIDDEWLPYEIHPETPKKGILLKECFPGMNPDAFYEQLNARGRQLGVRFAPQPLLSNSRMAMEAGEFAKAHGAYAGYHDAIFRAFFTDCLNIGDRAVILGAAEAAGLDRNELNAALDSGIYLPRLEEATRQAKSMGIRSVPTFLVDGGATITGAQPIEKFRAVLREAEKD